MYVNRVQSIVARVANAMVGESFLPDSQVGAQFFFRSVRGSALNELDGLLEAGQGRQDCVQMIGHDHEFVEQILFTPVMF